MEGTSISMSTLLCGLSINNRQPHVVVVVDGGGGVSIINSGILEISVEGA